MPLRMLLHRIHPAHGSRRKRKRIGRGNAAGGGTTGGRGTKGQQSRTGKGRRFGFEGGQTPLIRRQPKLGGFRNPRSMPFEILTLRELERRLQPGSYDVPALRAARMVTTNRPVKLVGNAPLSKKFQITVHAVSKGARALVEKAGGTVTLMKAPR